MKFYNFSLFTLITIICLKLDTVENNEINKASLILYCVFRSILTYGMPERKERTNIKIQRASAKLVYRIVV